MRKINRKESFLVMIRTFLICLLLLFISFNSTSQVSIKGSVKIDSTWRKEIYVSYVESLPNLYKCSEHLIIARGIIDDSGNWNVVLPKREESYLVRIHVSKKEDPVASLIIGGKNENHCFIAIDNSDSIEYKASDKSENIFSNFSCPENELNRKLFAIDSISNKWKIFERNISKENEKTLVREAAAVELLKNADTINDVLPAIYANYKADFGFNKDEVHNSLLNIQQKFKKHSYFSSHTDTIKSKVSFYYVLALLCIFLLIFFSLKVFTRYKSNKKKALFMKLSVREREVFHLIRSGKTNKEISQLLHVEMSTVKSHINSMYSKLKINTRAELLNFIDQEIKKA